MNQILLTLAFIATYLVLLAQPSLPEGFNIEWHSQNWTAPVDIDFDEKGIMYVSEKEGVVWIVKDGKKGLQPLIDISDEVANFGDNGLLSIALDKDFMNNGYFYMYYVVDRYHWMYSHQSDYDPELSQYWNATFARVTRYQADPEKDFEEVLPGSRFILIGKTNLDGIPSLYTSHVGGTIDVGDDGSLIVSTGDGSTWKKPYGGNGPPYNEEYVEQALNDGIIRPEEELGAFRAQYIDNFNGKILRINPMTGEGMIGNPFFSSEEPDAHRSKIYALGLRNGFRLKVREGSGSTDPQDGLPGVMYVMDVGNENWEELNVVKVPGQNFGWPLYEGIEPMTTFQEMNTQHPTVKASDQDCLWSEGYLFKDLIQQPKAVFPFNTFTDPCDENEHLGEKETFIHSLPAMAFGHWTVQGNFYVPLFDNDGAPYKIKIDEPGSPVMGNSKGQYGICGIVGDFYEGEIFPEWYHDKLFIGDYDRGWIKVIDSDDNDDIREIRDFFSDTIKISHIALNPIDGALYFVDFPNGIKKITYGQNVRPVADIDFDRNYGPSPLEVNFDATGSYDPNDDELSYEWDFGNGLVSDELTPTITFEELSGLPKTFTATLNVRDSGGLVGTDSTFISLNNSPPSVSITNVEDGDLYPTDGLTFLEMTASVNDAEHNVDELTYEWQLYLGHNTHEHPEPVSNDVSPTIRILPTSCGVEQFYYRIQLKVTDAEGLEGIDSKRLEPDCDGVFVNLLVLKLDQFNDAIELQWTTGFEKGLNKIFVERSVNRGLSYETIQELSGTNQGEANWNYTFRDDSSLDGNRTYRLRFESTRGQIVYSQSLDVNFVHSETINIFPNPANEQLFVQFGQLQNDGELFLFDSNGRLVLRKSFTQDGPLESVVDVRHILPGSYFFQLTNGIVEKSGKLIILER